MTRLTMSSTEPTRSLLAEAERPVALVVDDDECTRGLIADILRAAGWTVRQARNGEHALLMAREHVPELILLDLALPRMSGLEVLREMKSWADQPTTVVVVSFFAMLMQVSDLRLADSVVQKPFVASELLAQVAVATRRFTAQALQP